MAKVHTLDLPIRTWTPTADGDPCIAMIGRLPMIFKGKTPMQAHMAADRWRKTETEKAAAKDANARKRLEARKAAREAAE